MPSGAKQTPWVHTTHFRDLTQSSASDGLGLTAMLFPVLQLTETVRGLHDL